MGKLIVLVVVVEFVSGCARSKDVLDHNAWKYCKHWENYAGVGALTAFCRHGHIEVGSENLNGCQNKEYM